MSYRDDYTQIERDYFWTLPRIGCAFVMLIGLVVVLGIVGHVFGWFGEAADVAQQQFGPQALLDKYEWFKDASAQLDKKQADISVYQKRFKDLQELYAGVPRAQWAREDREQLNIWQSEVAGVTASYNQLAAEYNAQMAKFNYRFANAGALPQGAEKPLPREYKPYIGE
jgi:hypothetical protein